MSQWLSPIEPRPTLDVLRLDGLAFVVVTVQPCVRLVAHLGTKNERHRIMYPQRGSDRTFHMRPEEVEARVLTYGPRAERIRIQQLQARLDERERVQLYHTTFGGPTAEQAAQAHVLQTGPLTERRRVVLLQNSVATLEDFEDFGIRIYIRAVKPQASGVVLVPYEWLTPFVANRLGGGTQLALVLGATLLFPKRADEGAVFNLVPMP